MTTSKNVSAKIDVESKLVQVLSLAKVISDNHNYKDAGLDEPLISHCDTGNLIWLLNTLLEEIYEEYLNEE